MCMEGSVFNDLQCGGVIKADVGTCIARLLPCASTQTLILCAAMSAVAMALCVTSLPDPPQPPMFPPLPHPPGIVDSSDLPLNVSREILQESRIVRSIRKQLIRRSLDMMEDLAKKEGGEDYKTFWEAFGRNIKVGGGGWGVFVCGVVSAGFCLP